MTQIKNYKHTFFEKTLIHIILKFKSINEFLFDLENSIFKNKEKQNSKKIFITGLARSGTSSALDLFCQSGKYGYQTYEDMPFLMCPNLYSKFRSFFKKKFNIQPRSHSDGILISQGSPEAFEEFFWKNEMNNNYISNNFLLENHLSEENISNFNKYINLVLKKNNKEIYISKNNNNILRLKFISEKLNDSIILIFFRNPVAHCYSLLKQHLNFINLQNNNKFILDYMNYLGHFEFGKNLKRFEIGKYKENDPTKINFWIEIWINYYNYILKYISYNNVYLICYEDLALRKNEYLRKKINNEFLSDKINFYSYQNKNKFSDAPEANFDYAYQIYEKLRSKV